MKTFKNLEDMKKELCAPFGTQYDYFFEALADCYISKMSGIERIKAELEEWDNDTQQIIVYELIKVIEASGIIGFDRNEILSLVK